KVNQMAVSGNRLYTTSSAGLAVYIVNIFPPPLTLAGTVATVNPGDGVAVRGTVAYVTGVSDISIVDVSKPTSPRVVKTFAGGVLTPNSYNIDQVVGNLLLVASGFFVNANRFNLLIYDLTDPLNPVLLSSTPINYPFYRGLFVQGSTVLVPIAAV